MSDDLRGLTWKQLRALAATVEAGSVTGAAKSLYVTPPAITIQLKQLEAQIGAPIFNRTDSQFAVTDVGAELLGLAHDLDRLVARTAERVAALRSGATGSIVFGVVSTGKYIAPAMVAAFIAAHPEVRVKLVVGNRGEIIRGLEKNEFDLLLMGRPPAHVDVESTVLGDHPHIMIASPHHRLAVYPDIEAEDLLGERLLAREPGSGTRNLMERFLQRVGGGRSFEIVDTGSNETIKQAVIAGLGVAIISAHTCLAELRRGELVALPVPGLPLVRQWFILHRKDRAPTKAVDIFKRYVVERRHTLVPQIGPNDFRTPGGK
jgi:LysR family transcriptional regulator, low CO2-responsive transcriptional regulator